MRLSQGRVVRAVIGLSIDLVRSRVMTLSLWEAAAATSGRRRPVRSTVRGIGWRADPLRAVVVGAQVVRLALRAPRQRCLDVGAGLLRSKIQPRAHGTEASDQRLAPRTVRRELPRMPDL
jgi:hypothetical protein